MDKYEFSQIFIIATVVKYSIKQYNTCLLYTSMWKIFSKAGEKGWKSLIPISLTIYLDCKLAKAFVKSSGFTVGLILLPSIFYLILGFGKSEYVGTQEN